jgi:hypothetical protein
MKIKILMALIAVSVFAASCKDKKSAEELANVKKQMMANDSMCQASKQMLMDSIMMLNMKMDSLMMPANTTGSKSTSSKTNTTTKTTTTTGKDVNNRGGSTGDVKKETNERGGTKETEVKKDVTKRGGGK